MYLSYPQNLIPSPSKTQLKKVDSTCPLEKSEGGWNKVNAIMNFKLIEISKSDLKFDSVIKNQCHHLDIRLGYRIVTHAMWI